MTGRVVVIGVGNPFRRDDGVGAAVVEALREKVPDSTVLAVSDGEPSRMLDLWHGADTAVVVEAVRSRPARPGRLHTLSAAEAAAHRAGPASTHALGLGECLALGTTLDRLPRELVVHAVEVSDTGLGAGLSEAVRAALPELIDRVAASVRTAQGRHRRETAGAVPPAPPAPGSQRLAERRSL